MKSVNNCSINILPGGTLLYVEDIEPQPGT
jgi:hypothetical protein